MKNYYRWPEGPFEIDNPAMTNKEQIIKLRKDLTQVINNQIKPMRAALDRLLQVEAALICPFTIGDVITLDNGKLGQINRIGYYSLGKNYNDEISATYAFLQESKVDEIEYLYAYQADDEEFTITWEIAGVYMIKQNTVPGKIRFYGINPANYTVDKTNSSVKAKNLNELVADDSFLSDFTSLI